jgi:hypothetical protein
MSPNSTSASTHPTITAPACAIGSVCSGSAAASGTPSASATASTTKHPLDLAGRLAARAPPQRERAGRDPGDDRGRRRIADLGGRAEHERGRDPEHRQHDRTEPARLDAAQADPAQQHGHEHAHRGLRAADRERVQNLAEAGVRERVGAPVERERADQRRPAEAARRDHAPARRHAREALERDHGRAEEEQRHRVDPEREREDQPERDGAACGGQHGPRSHEQLAHPPSPSLGRMCGNVITSRRFAAPVRIIASRSTPMPSPPVGGSPISSARR